MHILKEINCEGRIIVDLLLSQINSSLATQSH